MALFGDQNPIMGMEDEDKKKQMSSPAPGSIIQGAGGTTMATGQGQGGPQKSTSGRAANLQSYLKANQQNTLGEKVGQKVQGQANQIAQNINQAKSTLQSAAQPEQSRLQQYQNYAQKIEQDPTQFSPEEIQNFQKYRTGSYEAPEVANLSDLQGQSQKVQNLADMAGTETGRFQLLKEAFGRPTYSTGQQRLDQLLLQANKPQSAALTAQAREAKQNALQGITGLQSEQDALRSALGQQAGDIQTQAGNLLGGQKTNLEQAAEQQYSQAQQESKQQEDLYNSLLKQFSAQGQGGQGRIGSPMLNQEDPTNFLNRNKDLGQASPELSQAYRTIDSLKNSGNIDESTYNQLNQQLNQMYAYGSVPFDGRPNMFDALKNDLSFKAANNLTKEGVTTPEQRARYQALQRLGGETESQFSPELYEKAKASFDPSKSAELANAGKEQALARSIYYDLNDQMEQRVKGGEFRRGDEAYNAARAQLTNQLVSKYHAPVAALNGHEMPDEIANYRNQMDIMKKLGLYGGA